MRIFNNKAVLYYVWSPLPSTIYVHIMDAALLNSVPPFHVRILTSFGAGDLGTEVDFLYSVMWVTKVTF